MDYFIPRHMKGFVATDAQREAAKKAGRDPDRVGTPYQVFRGIHHIPDALANSTEANRLGIKPVEEMTGDEWRQVGLNRETWMRENRPPPAVQVGATGATGAALPGGATGTTGTAGATGATGAA